MFGMGGVEMLVIGIVALIVVGPKDLPVLFRNVGQFVGRARGMARDFQSAMNSAARESGVNDITQTIQGATNPIGSAMDSVKNAASDATKGLHMDLDSLDDDRADMARKIQASTAQAANDRQAQEASADQADAPEKTPGPENNNQTKSDT